MIGVTDVFSRKKRSELMSRIRSKGTAVEESLYSIVRESIAARWTIDRNVSGLPGHPDIVIRELRLAIFAHGCFYHCCSQHGHIPKSNREYWSPKLASNLKRDRLNRSRLRRQGFSVWTIWEHALEGFQLQRTRLMMQRRLNKFVLEKAARRENRY